MKNWKRVSSLMLTAALSLSLLPSVASAAEPEITWLPWDWTVGEWRGLNEENFHDGYFVVKKLMANGDQGGDDDWAWGVMDTAGNLVIPVEQHYSSLEAPHCGRLLARDKETRDFGYLDLEGNVAIPFIHATANTFNDMGYAYVRESNWKNERYINVNGEEAFSIRDFRILVNGHDTQIYQYGEADYRLTIYGPENQILVSGIPADWNSGVRLLDGNKIALFRNGKVGVVDFAGETVVPFQYDKPMYPDMGSAASLGIRYLENDMIVVGRDENGDGQAVMFEDSFSLMDQSGNLAFPFGIYDVIGGNGFEEDFDANGLIAVRSKETGNYGLMDKIGQVVIPCIYDSRPTRIEEAGETYYFMSEQETPPSGEARKQVILDKNGNTVVDLTGKYRDYDGYCSVEYHGEGIFSVQQDLGEDEQYGRQTTLLDLYGNELGVLSDNITLMGEFCDGYALVNTADDKANPLYYYRSGLLKNPLLTPTPVEAIITADLHITYNGVEQVFTDANSVPVLPLTYHGTTYLPVRAVAGLVGLRADWDASTETVLLATDTGSVAQYSRPGSPSGTTRVVTATLNRDMTVTLDGAAQTFQDTNGQTVYPIVYNGTTYLPVRAISGLVGLSIEWDGATNTVKLAEK